MDKWTCTLEKKTFTIHEQALNICNYPVKCNVCKIRAWVSWVTFDFVFSRLRFAISTMVFSQAVLFKQGLCMIHTATFSHYLNESQIQCSRCLKKGMHFGTIPVVQCATQLCMHANYGICITFSTECSWTLPDVANDSISGGFTVSSWPS